MSITFLMICVLLVALSLLCVSLANFSLSVGDNMPKRDTVRDTVAQKDRLMALGIADDLLSYTD